MSIMDSTTPASGRNEPIPVNRFALFSETLLAGLLVLVLSIPLVTIPAAYAAGIAHLERHLSGRDDSVRALWGDVPRCPAGQLEAGNHDGGSRRRDCPEPAARNSGAAARQRGGPPGHPDPGGRRCGPAPAHRRGLVRLCRSGCRRDRLTSGSAPGGVPPSAAWSSALATGKALSLRDWTGSLLLAAALFAAVVFVWMLVALFVVVPGMLDPGLRLGQNAFQPRLAAQRLELPCLPSSSAFRRNYRVEPDVSSDRPQSAESLHTPKGPVRWYHPLTQHNYRLFMGMTLAGSMGVWMQRLAQDWLVLQLTGSPAAVGVAVALQFLPMLMVGPLSGLLVDIFPKRSVMMVCQSVIVLLALGLAAWDASGGITVWAVYGSCVALGITSAIDGPARQVFVNEVVGDAGLRPAIGLNNAIGQLGAMVGPAFGGVVIAHAGSAAAFACQRLSWPAGAGHDRRASGPRSCTRAPRLSGGAASSWPGSGTCATGRRCSW